MEDGCSVQFSRSFHLCSGGFALAIISVKVSACKTEKTAGTGNDVLASKLDWFRVDLHELMKESFKKINQSVQKLETGHQRSGVKKLRCSKAVWTKELAKVKTDMPLLWKRIDAFEARQ
ncbi:MAG: hypothetical protein LBC69_00885, partial [Eubacteriaceae bacterium]|nr:hypothetical protein [Eubacteriaceae bacterium]